MPIDLNDEEAQKLEDASRAARIALLQMAAKGAPVRLGGALSAVDVLSVLYGACVYGDPAQPDQPDRDRVVVSDARALPAQCAVMAELGFLPKEAVLDGSALSPDPGGSGGGAEVVRGPAGLGVSFALGLALAARYGEHPFHVYAVAADGELQGGAFWEAVLFAGHHRIDNLTVIVDRNGFQDSGRVDEQISLNPLPDKFWAFGWNAVSADGHNVRALAHALSAARECIDMPSAVVANTTRGKGLYLAEKRDDWRDRPLTTEELEQALRELGG